MNACRKCVLFSESLPFVKEKVSQSLNLFDTTQTAVTLRGLANDIVIDQWLRHVQNNVLRGLG